jgi:hypothetical protein
VASLKITGPETIKVNRSQLRKNQSKLFRRAQGRRIIQVTGWSEEDEKYVVDKRYFDDLLKKLWATVETLEITADPKMFAQILRAAETIDENARSGRLHSFAEALGQD